MNSDELEIVKTKLAQARDNRKFVSHLIAAIQANQESFENNTPEEVCQILDVPISYKHTVRAVLQVKDCIDDYKVN